MVILSSLDDGCAQAYKIIPIFLVQGKKKAFKVQRKQFCKKEFIFLIDYEVGMRYNNFITAMEEDICTKAD
jgi:hypothetical protein